MDWDAGRYHRLSDPQLAWGRRVLQRLAPSQGELILDIGCGTGRLTAELADRIGSGRVVALDRSEAMLAQAAQALGATLRRRDVLLVRADGAHLPFCETFDAVFSTATFHWIVDHDSLFRGIYRALVPGGRIVAQCGGGPNLEKLLDRAHRLMRTTFFHHFNGWSDPWCFADVSTTSRRLQRAGFAHIDVSLEPAPTSLPDAQTYSEFLSCVCVRHHVARLPVDDRPAFLAVLTEEAAADNPPFTLDYWRLNIAARKPATRERAA